MSRKSLAKKKESSAYFPKKKKKKNGASEYFYFSEMYLKEIQVGLTSSIFDSTAR
jgi:hypothetical protein